MKYKYHEIDNILLWASIDRGAKPVGGSKLLYQTYQMGTFTFQKLNFLTYIELFNIAALFLGFLSFAILQTVISKIHKVITDFILPFCLFDFFTYLSLILFVSDAELFHLS